MTLRCKVGDQAIVVAGDVECIGREVTVVKRVLSGDTVLFKGRELVTVGFPDSWWVLFREGSGGFFLDQNLLPLRPEHDETTTTEHEVTA